MTDCLKEQGLVSIKKLWVDIHYSACGGLDRLCEAPGPPRRMLGGVGTGGEKPPVTRLGDL
ncbi:MAG: hypothetical protein Q8N82_04855, partial [Deltaproteobacteria bacterium]|nr:hypothetical protein [Deltaproteobacteria bacterium]